MRNVIVFIVAACFMVGLTSCSPAPSTSPVKAPSTASNSVTIAKEAPVVDAVPAPYSWNGTWVTDPQFMEAKIVGNLITVNIVTEDSKSLFWKGTWDPAAKATDGTTIISKADVEALSGSIMGSSEKTKPFTFNNDELTFEFSMMGTTKTVRIRK